MSAGSKQRIILRNGTVLDDRFEIIELLGAGCFGAVYRARQLAFGREFRQVALKLFDAELVNRRNMREVFNDALAVIGMLENQPDHEVARRIVPVYDIGLLHQPAPERAFISMKLIGNGRTLQSQVRRFEPHGMPVLASLKYLHELLIPLAWMHTMEGADAVVHGDLKPDNILLTDKFELILADFGVASRLPIGSAGGAISYQAPETLLKVCDEQQSDMYAVGIIWYELLTSTHPFEKVGLDALACNDSQGYVREHQEARQWPIRPLRPGEDLMAGRIVPASELNSELKEHPQVEQMLNRCLAYRQSDRYPNARVLLDDIRRYQSGVPVQTSTLPSTPAKAEPLSTTRDKTADALVADAQSFLQLNRIADAIASAQAAIKIDGGCLPAALMLVKAYCASRQFENAKEAWAASQKLAPKNPEVFDAAADMYQAMGKPGMAGPMRDRAVQLRQNRRS